MSMHSRWRTAAALLADPDLRPYLYRLLPGLGPRRAAGRQEPPYLRAESRPGPTLAPWPLRQALVRWGSLRVDQADWTFSLASTTIGARSELRLPWDASFADPEDDSALHRFAWLLPWVVARAREGAAADQVWRLIDDAITDWLESGTRVAHAWQPYTIAERMMNWTLSALATGRDVRSDERLAGALAVHADRLSGDLEYYGDVLTGNHLSNNGRALYVVGLVIGHPDAAARGRMVLLHEAPRLFREPWFLREGSSHYQFLITRNYTEALWAAQVAGDRETADVLAPIVSALVAGCRFFLVWSSAPAGPAMPVIGDLSPDCTPDWSLGVSEVGAFLTGMASDARSGLRKTSGWHTLFEMTAALHPPQAHTGAPAAVSDEWARVDAAGWTIFAHVNPGGAPYGHAHQDTGAIVVFRDGRPVVLDTGRCHYLDDEVGTWGKSAAAHSSLTVDGLEPAPSWHWLYPAGALERLVGGPPRLERRPAELIIAHRGFSRHSAVTESRRLVKVVSPSRIEIIDELDGCGAADLRLTFHLDAMVTAYEGGMVTATGESVRLRMPELTNVAQWCAPSDRRTYGWATAAYGALRPITSLVATGSVSLPWTGTTVLEVGP